MSEWNLSDFVRPADTCPTSEIDMILVSEVREFIKRLKENLKEDFIEACAYQLLHGKTQDEKITLLTDWLRHKIDKLAGSKLVKND